MDTRRSLRNVIVSTSGSAGSARRDHSAGTGRAHAARGTLVSALVFLAAAGAMAAATPAYAVGGRIHPSAAQAAAGLITRARADSAGTCEAGQAPRLAITPQTVWIYGKPRTVWIYGKPQTVWIYGKPQTVWIYGKPQTVWIYVITNKTFTMSSAIGRAPSVAPASSRAKAACLRLASGI